MPIGKKYWCFNWYSSSRFIERERERGNNWCDERYWICFTCGQQFRCSVCPVVSCLNEQTKKKKQIWSKRRRVQREEENLDLRFKISFVGNRWHIYLCLFIYSFWQFPDSQWDCIPSIFDSIVQPVWLAVSDLVSLCVCVCSPLELFLLRLISNRLGIIETTEPSGDWNKNIYDFFSFGVFVEISVDFSKILFGRLECIAQMMLFNQFLTSVFSLSLAVGSLQRRYTLNGHICRHIEHTDDILLVNSVILSRCISIFFGFLNERNEWKRSTEKNVAFHAAESEWQHESVRSFSQRHSALVRRSIYM